MKTKNVIKYSCFSIFAIICFAQCYSIIKNLLQDPLAVNMYDISPDLLTILPGITICNNNRLSLRKLLQRNATLDRVFRYRFPGRDLFKPDHRMDEQELTEFRDNVLRIFNELGYNPQTELDNLTMNDSFLPKPDTEDFIRWLGCARTWTNSIECGKLSMIESLQDRKCVTILHKGAMHHDIANKPNLFNSTRISVGRHNYFDAKEIVKILIDFDAEDYGDLKRQIGARIIFHAGDYVASSTDRDFFVTRGQKYDFYLDRNDAILINSSKAYCFDYHQANLDKYKERIDPRWPLYVDACFQNCVTQNIIRRSNCWPSTLPYFRNDSFDPYLNLKSCSWFREAQYFSIYKEFLRVESLKKRRLMGLNTTDGSRNEIKAKEKVLKLYMRIKRFCWNRCLFSCDVLEYTVGVSKSVWPPEVKIALDKTGVEKNLRHCCAMITVRYSHFHHNVNQFIFKYNLIDIVGNLGGLLAVWLGISIVSVYHGIQKIIEIYTCRKCIKVHAIESSFKIVNRVRGQNCLKRISTRVRGILSSQT